MGGMWKTNNVNKSWSSKSCKSPLQKKESCDKNQEKTVSFFTDRNDGIDSHSYGDQTDTVKVK